MPGPSGGVEINSAPESEQSPRSELARAGAASAPPLEFGRDSVAGGWEGVARLTGCGRRLQPGTEVAAQERAPPSVTQGHVWLSSPVPAAAEAAGRGAGSRRVWPGHALCGHVPRPQRHTLSWPDPLASQV